MFWRHCQFDDRKNEAIPRGYAVCRGIKNGIKSGMVVNPLDHRSDCEEQSRDDPSRVER